VAGERGQEETVGLGKKLRDWNAASAAFESERDAGLSPGTGRAGGRAPSEAQVVATVLKVVALLEAALGSLSGIAVGRAVDDVSRPLGLTPAGWVVILGALVTALVLYALGVGLACLDDIRHNTGRSPGELTRR
jgi:hypothetical protein